MSDRGGENFSNRSLPLNAAETELNGTEEKEALYSDRNKVSVSNRSLLANALESTVTNEIERKTLDEYKAELGRADALEKELAEIRSKIRDLSFAKGPKDTEGLKKLRERERKTATLINDIDSKLIRLEATKPLKDIIHREKDKAYKRAEQEGEELLREYRASQKAKYEEIISRYQESRKEALKNREKAIVKHHYNQIDKAIKRETELREQTEKECASHESAELHELKKKKIGLLIAWLAVVALFTTIVFYLFSFDTILVPLIISVIIASTVAVRISSSLTDKHTEFMRIFRQRKENDTNWEITRMYRELLDGTVIHSFLGIPEDIIFIDGQPSNANEKSNLPKPYGSYNRYVSLNYGERFHTVEGCSGARFPINAIELSYNNYKIGYRQYTPCSICVRSWNSAIVVPEWYPYYVKVKTITDKYGIKVLFEYRKGKQAKG